MDVSVKTYPVEATVTVLVVTVEDVTVVVFNRFWIPGFFVTGNQLPYLSFVRVLRFKTGMRVKFFNKYILLLYIGNM